MNTLLRNIIPVFFLAFIVSCGRNDSPSQDISSDSLQVKSDVDMVESNVVYNIPNPMETFMMLKMSGVKFNRELLNSLENISKYDTHFSKALNLGVYSADLSFCFLYEKNNEINKYIKNINELTAALDIDGEFMKSATERAKTNSDNLDSIREIISEVSVHTNLYLKEHEMNSTNAAIVAGGWVESTYIMARLASSSKKEDIIGLVADQKYVLQNLKKILEQFNDDATISDLLADINGISEVYAALQTTQNEPSGSDDKKIQSIGNNTSVELSEEQLKTILDKVTTLRTKITN